MTSTEPLGTYAGASGKLTEPREEVQPMAKGEYAGGVKVLVEPEQVFKTTDQTEHGFSLDLGDIDPAKIDRIVEECGDHTVTIIFK